MGLREFLRRNPIVHVVEFPGIGEKIGAVPLSVALPDDVRALFAHPSGTETPRGQRIAYAQHFWDGFIRPFEGHSRYVILDESGQVTVRDGPPENENERGYEITPEDLTASLPDQPIAGKVEATHSAIDRWLEKNSLEAWAFARPGGQRRKVVVGSRLARLIAAFDGLRDEDLARVKIPMDVLIKMNSRDGD